MPHENTPRAVLEANASHAVGQYLCMGPSKPYDQMRVSGMEGARSRLRASPSATNQEVQGWVAIEQAFVIREDAELRERYPIGHLFEEAEEAFRASMDLYDKTKDPPDHLLNMELGLGALPLYEIWASQRELKPQDVGVFQNAVVRIGHKLITLQEREGQDWDSDTKKYFGGFAAELVTLLAFNRRQKDGFDDVPAFAVPSTFRQDKARQPGRSSGGRFDKSQLRGNWDVSVVEQTAGRLALRDKLQVKSITEIADKPAYGAVMQEYTEDITVVSVEGHLCRGTNTGSSFKPLQTLLDASTPGAPKKLKTVAASISRELYGHIARSREDRASMDSLNRLHVYRANPRPNRK